MLNGCVSLTDGSEYLDRTLRDGAQAIFYSLKDLEQLPAKIKKYLQEPERLQKIARQGYEYAKVTQTWQYRAKQLAEMIQKG